MDLKEIQAMQVLLRFFYFVGLEPALWSTVIKFNMSDLLFLVCSICGQIVSIDDMIDHSNHCQLAMENTNKVASTLQKLQK
ncbi:MAG: hypothetical protein EZS28_030698, partial [Streblomastix strix]